MIGFPARYEGTYECGLGGHGAGRIIAEAFEQLGWKYSMSEEGAFLGKVPLSGLSWGETVTVEILPGNLIKIESRCAWQIIDWGKNKTNVTRFIGELQRNGHRYGRITGVDDENFQKDASSRVDKMLADKEAPHK